MKKVILFLVAIFILGIYAGPVMAGDGPAPKSGDGISDGSGMETQKDPKNDSTDSPVPVPAPDEEKKASSKSGVDSTKGSKK